MRLRICKDIIEFLLFWDDLWLRAGTLCPHLLSVLEPHLGQIHSLCGFLYTLVQLRLQSLVSLVSSIHSDSYTLSASWIVPLDLRLGIWWRHPMGLSIPRPLTLSPLLSCVSLYLFPYTAGGTFSDDIWVWYLWIYHNAIKSHLIAMLLYQSNSIRFFSRCLTYLFQVHGQLISVLGGFHLMECTFNFFLLCSYFS